MYKCFQWLTLAPVLTDSSTDHTAMPEGGSAKPTGTGIAQQLVGQVPDLPNAKIPENASPHNRRRWSETPPDREVPPIPTPTRPLRPEKLSIVLFHRLTTGTPAFFWTSTTYSR